MTIEDKKQQQNLKNFDRTLRESTGQLVWFLYAIFAACALVLSFILIYDRIDWENAWTILSYICMVAWMDTYILAPYRWGNESFSKRVPQSDSISKILMYVPLSAKGYIRVRMGYLWRSLWKFAAFGMLILLGSMGVMHAFSFVKVMEGVVLLLLFPLLIGYIEVRGSLSF